MRIEGWAKRLKAVVELHRDLPGQWGVSDCWILSCEAYQAVTGEVLAPDLRDYHSEAGGYRLFARHGFGTVGAALAAHLPAVPPLMAQRGDLGTITRGGVESCGVLTALGLAVKTLYTDGSAVLEYHPVTAMTAAFKVG